MQWGEVVWKGFSEVTLQERNSVVSATESWRAPTEYTLKPFDMFCVLPHFNNYCD